MREIKFMAYIEEHKEMCHVLSIDFTNDCFYVLTFDELEGGSQIEVKGLEKLRQYTGLKDKKGKEIYEGDILFPDIGVTWNKTRSAFHPFFIEDYGAAALCVSTEEEVIGNIYENPELV